MRTPEIAIAVIKDPQRGYLLIQRAYEKAFPGTWAFPSGHIEAHETPRDAVQRELLEEAGLRAVGETTPIGVIQGDDPRYQCHVYVIPAYAETPKSGHEEIGIGWFHEPVLRSLIGDGASTPLIGRILDLLTEKS